MKRWWNERRRKVQPSGRSTTISKVATYLTEKGLEFKEAAAGELRVSICPFCGAEDHFYINSETGLYNCKKGNCHVSGNLFTLKRHLGDLKQVQSAQEVLGVSLEGQGIEFDINMVKGYHVDLLKDERVLGYLATRKILPQTARRFWLGVAYKQNASWLAIPYFERGKLVNVKYRSLPPADKTFFTEEGGSHPLFNDEAVDTDRDVMVCEGELDAMSVWQMGFHNVVSVPHGAESFLPQHFDRLVDKRRVYLCYDNDVVGQKAAHDVARRLGRDRCYRLLLPVKDANEFLMKGFESSDFQALLDEARVFGEDEIQSIDRVFTELEERVDPDKRTSSDKRVVLPWTAMQKIIDEIEPGELVAVCAVPKVGKCLPGWVRVMNHSTGVMLPLERWAQIEEFLTVQTYDELNQPHLRKGVKVFKSGEKEVLKLQLRSGKVIELSTDHPLLTGEGWKEALCVKVGECVATPRQLLSPLHPLEVSDEEVMWVAHMIAEGSTSSNGCSFSNKDPRMLDDYRHCCKVLQEQYSVGRKGWWQTIGTGNKGLNEVVTIGPRGMTFLLDKWGLRGLTSRGKRVPPEFFGLSDRQLALFVNRLFAGDAYVPMRESTGCTRTALEYCCVCEGLVRDLQLLLLRFGVHSTVSSRTIRAKGKPVLVWTLAVRSKINIIRLIEAIGAILGREDRCHKILAHLSKVTSHEQYDTIPLTYQELYERFGQVLGTGRYSGLGRYRRCGSRGERRFFQSALDMYSISDPTLRSYVGDVFWDKVVKVSSIGRQSVYDLSVPWTHNFVANGVIVHNTSYCLHVVHHNVMANDIPSLFWCLEMTPWQLLTRLIAKHRHIAIKQVNSIDVMYARAEMQGKPLYMCGASLEMRPDLVFNTLEYAVKRFGLQLIVFDNLQFLVRGDNVVEQTGQITRRFKLFAEAFGVRFILVIQPRKIPLNVMPSPMDLKNTSDISADVDKMIFLHRNLVGNWTGKIGEEDFEDQQAVFEPRMLVRVVERNGPGGACTLWFQGDMGTITDILE